MAEELPVTRPSHRAVCLCSKAIQARPSTKPRRLWAGLSYTEGTLEQVELANKPGALAQLAGRLAKKGATAFIPDVSANSSDFCLQPCSIITSGEGTRGS